MAVSSAANSETFKVTTPSRYPSIDVRDIVLKTGMEKGAAISYDRLEDVVALLKAQA